MRQVELLSIEIFLLFSGLLEGGHPYYGPCKMTDAFDVKKESCFIVTVLSQDYVYQFNSADNKCQHFEDILWSGMLSFGSNSLGEEPAYTHTERENWIQNKFGDLSLCSLN